MKNIVVFASGEGTNLQTLIDSVNAGSIKGRIALVISSKNNAGALKRARQANIPCETANPKDFPTPEKYDEHLTTLCQQHKADLLCLAGFMLKLGHKLLSTYENRIINVHPALLPAYGGKGYYGMKVHEAVLAAGAKLSGATIHYVTEVYDSGPIIMQQTVPVFADDTPETLAKRVGAVEHALYPKAAALYCEDRLQLKGRMVHILPPATDKKIKRALISLSDKTGAVDFARELAAAGIEIVSTSGTYKLLKDTGLPVRPLETLTGFPEMLDGRVKTLHPMVHGGILFKREDAAHTEAVLKFGIEPIDMVVVNLYPFEETAKKAAAWSEELIENIDIGGVALLRAAAKNYKSVAVISSPADYAPVLAALKEHSGALPIELLKELAVKAFRHTGAYDTAICKELAGPAAGGKFPARLETGLNKIYDLRYGENPHQAGALYSRGEKLPFTQLQGKELSFNNILDAYGSYQTVINFKKPAAVIFKHVTPSGCGAGDDIMQAFERAWNGDPLSAFGGIIALNRPLDGKIAGFLAKKFVEVICAPAFDAAALEIFAKKTNLRLLRWDAAIGANLLFRSVGGEVLVCDDDTGLLGDKWEVPTRRKPSEEEEEALRFAWTAAKYVRSNAIVLADEHQTVGIGAGQMSRVDSVFMAGHKYAAFLKDNPRPRTMVMASDAFFPFPDALEEGVKLGATAIIQPGGSVKDKEVIAAADALGVAMVLTGMRHFRH